MRHCTLGPWPSPQPQPATCLTPTRQGLHRCKNFWSQTPGTASLTWPRQHADDRAAGRRGVASKRQTRLAAHEPGEAAHARLVPPAQLAPHVRRQLRAIATEAWSGHEGTRAPPISGIQRKQVRARVRRVQCMRVCLAVHAGSVQAAPHVCPQQRAAVRATGSDRVR